MTTTAPAAANEISLPFAIQHLLRWAVRELDGARIALSGVERVRGRGHIFALEWRDQQPRIAAAGATLAEIRGLADANGGRAAVEAYILGVGGEPDLRGFQPQAEVNQGGK